MCVRETVRACVGVWVCVMYGKRSRQVDVPGDRKAGVVSLVV